MAYDVTRTVLVTVSVLFLMGPQRTHHGQGTSRIEPWGFDGPGAGCAACVRPNVLQNDLTRRLRFLAGREQQGF